MFWDMGSYYVLPLCPVAAQLQAAKQPKLLLHKICEIAFRRRLCERKQGGEESSQVAFIIGK